jgi:hypothetical protein
MSRAPGRRVAARTSGPPRQGPLPGLAALLLVTMTIGALFAAGDADLVTGAQPSVSSRVDVAARTFACAGGLPGTAAVSGTVSQGGAVRVDGRTPRTDTVQVRKPVEVVADRAASPGAYAVQQAVGPRWLAAVGCPEPRPTWWFVGAGATDRHDTVLTITNPRPGSAIFDVDVIGAHGPVDAPGLHGLTLASGETRTLDLARFAPSTGDLAVRVRTSRGLVAVSAAESWAATLIGKTVHEWVAPQPAPARSVTLTGIPGRSGTLVLANPGAREAVVRLRLVGKRGTFNPTRHASLTVSPGTVEDVDVSDIVGPGTTAVRLAANVPVAATLRSVHQGDEGYAFTARPLRGDGAVGVPSGTHARLVLASVPATGNNTGRQQARARVRVLAPDGRRLRSRTVTVPAAGSVTTQLPRGAGAVAVAVPDADVVGALVLTSGPGIGALPLSGPVAAERLPGVAPGW